MNELNNYIQKTDYDRAKNWLVIHQQEYMGNDIIYRLIEQVLDFDDLTYSFLEDHETNTYNELDRLMKQTINLINELLKGEN